MGHGGRAVKVCMVIVGNGKVSQWSPSISDTVPCSNQHTVADTLLDLIFSKTLKVLLYISRTLHEHSS